MAAWSQHAIGSVIGDWFAAALLIGTVAVSVWLLGLGFSAPGSRSWSIGCSVLGSVAALLLSMVLAVGVAMSHGAAPRSPASPLLAAALPLLTGLAVIAWLAPRGQRLLLLGISLVVMATPWVALFIAGAVSSFTSR